MGLTSLSSVCVMSEIKLGDLVQVKDGLYGWGSPGVVIKIDQGWKCPVYPKDDESLTIHILGLTMEVHTWYDFQLEVISEVR